MVGERMIGQFAFNKVYQGDCIENIKLLPDASIDCIVTDIPYKMYPRGRTARIGFDQSFSHIKKQADLFRVGLPDHKALLTELYRVVKPQAHMYMFLGIRDFLDVLQAAKETGWELCNQLIWVKNNSIVNRYFMNTCEFIYLFCRKKDRRKRINNCSEKNVLYYDIVRKVNGKKFHPTEKPVDLMKMLISMSSNEGDIILDPYSGSCAVGVASIYLNRLFIGFDIKEEYVDISNLRLSETIGAKRVNEV